MAVNRRKFSFPADLSVSLQNLWGEDFLEKSSLNSLVEQIKYISDHFQQRECRKTPWEHLRMIQAYAVYFHGLNTIRLQAVLQELKRFFPTVSKWKITDFGSGLGASEMALSAVYKEGPLSWLFVEKEEIVANFHRQLRRTLPNPATAQWQSEAPNPPIVDADLLMASYSINELQSPPSWLSQYRTLLLVEPATRKEGRNLMSLRTDLINKGYTILAPCTHQMACPLLNKSQHDWCHDRIFVDAPAWFKNLENKLPMTNETATFSYLIATREPVAPPTGIRVIGDTLFEKGKTRQMICRGENREFFSWLKRHGPAQVIPRGSIVQLSGEGEKKGDEIRIKPGDLQNF